MLHSADEHDPIVIAGFAVEAPGGLDTAAAYWDALAESRELIGPFPRDRDWPIEQLLALGKVEGWQSVADAGGFLAGAAEFDPMFFGITPREATAMDPQQRVALRVAWRAIENTGMNPGALAGSEVGCFIGASGMEYGPRAAEINEYSGHRVTSVSLGAISGRISHCLGLVGPAYSVDSACASSLTAVHLAASALRNDECDWALAGSVCVMGSPAAFYEFSKNNALATDGHCRAFSADASGTVWGEGAGVVVLEKESRARELGHRVWGRILATRINHNGKGMPLIVPSARAQEQLISKTIAASGIDPALVGMIEGHGTATPLGDPLELIALQKTYGAAERSGPGPWLGSVKSNFGHAQAASGMLGLAKVLLSGDKGLVPPTLYADRPSEKIDWEAANLRLPGELEKWEPIDGIRYGAVSSFGAGGTNAHAIIAMPVEEEDHL